MDKKTAIILLNWNSFECTRDCIESLKAIPREDYDIILVDNNSMDQSVDKLVENLLSSVDTEAIILDPFSGTATTGLVAAERGNQAVTFDINPFLIWLGNAKYRNYTEDCLLEIREKVQQALKEYKSFVDQDNWTPQIFNIERWWSSYTLNILASLRTALVRHFGEPEENDDSNSS